MKLFNIFAKKNTLSKETQNLIKKLEGQIVSNREIKKYQKDGLTAFVNMAKLQNAQIKKTIKSLQVIKG